MDIAIFSSPLSKGQIIPEGERGEFRSSVERKEERTTRKKRKAVEEHTLRMREKETRARVVDDTIRRGRECNPSLLGEEKGEGKVKAKHRRWKLAPCSRIGKRDAATW